MYFSSHDFHFYIRDLDGAWLTKWLRIASSMLGQKVAIESVSTLPKQICVRMVILTAGQPKWSNLLRWLKDFHAGRCIGLPRKVSGVRQLNTPPICSAFNIVRQLKNVHWSVVAGILEQYRLGVNCYSYSFE